MYTNLREFIGVLKKEGELQEIKAEVDPYLELAEIHRRVIDESGPALLFTNIKESSFPVVTNLFGTEHRVKLAFGAKPENLTNQIINLMHEMIPPTFKSIWENKSTIKRLLNCGLKKIAKKSAPVLQCAQDPVNLHALPIITSWPEDGGPFVTLPLVYTECPNTHEHNLGMYRIQIYDHNTTGMHWQIHKGGGFHHFAAEIANQALQTHLFLGGPPALIASAIAPLPEAFPELMLASLLIDKKINVTYIKDNPYPYIAEAEFAISGKVLPQERRLEGPFGDHYGYYSLEHEFPVFKVESIHHRADAIYPATIVGKPKQEDYFLGEFLQKLLAPAFPLAMPGVIDLWAYAESGIHALAAAVIRESYSREALTNGFRILGEGQLSLTKFLILTDKRVDLSNFKLLLETVLLRFDPARDLMIFADTSIDTLDYTGRKFNHGSKALLIGVGEPKNSNLATRYSGFQMPDIVDIKAYCTGALVLYTDKTYADMPNLAQTILEHYSDKLTDWALIFLTDERNILQDQTSFLWSIFTRFDPANDMYANYDVASHKIKYKLPIIIDARMKPGYPDEVVVDEITKKLVDNKWASYWK